MISKPEFYRGLICALRSVGNEGFWLDGQLHSAFGKLKNFDQKDFPHFPIRSLVRSYDAVFGVYRDADAMIIHGMQDLMICLAAPANKQVFFTSDFTVKQARKELMRDIPHASDFESIAIELNKYLTDKKYLVIPGPTRLVGEKDWRNVKAPELIKAYDVDAKDCFIKTDAKKFNKFGEDLICLIPRRDQQDYRVSKCFKLGGMYEAGWLKRD